jgi:Uma2 family endonuclease
LLLFLALGGITAGTLYLSLSWAQRHLVPGMIVLRRGQSSARVNIAETLRHLSLPVSLILGLPLGHVAELGIPIAAPPIMGMPDLLEPIYWTAEMVRSLPDDGKRYEVVHGELLVTPSPRLHHQLVLVRLGHALATYLERQPVGQILQSPADISWDEGTLVQPDVFVAPLDEIRTMDWTRVQHLLLVIEVLSPSTARQDRFAKRRRYQEAGVPVYWIVDPDLQQVEVWGPADRIPRVERDRVEWSPPGAEVPFHLDLRELFKPI